MKKFLLALPLILASTTAFAAGTTVTNNSGLPIDELFVSAPGAKAFGPNLMEGMKEGVLDDGKTATVAMIADGKYDFKVSAPDEGVLCVISGLTVAGGKIKLTAENGKACK